MVPITDARVDLVSGVTDDLDTLPR
jgi:hypothetical protein